MCIYMNVCVYKCVYIYMNHCAIHRKLMQCYKSTMHQFEFLIKRIFELKTKLKMIKTMTPFILLMNLQFRQHLTRITFPAWLGILWAGQWLEAGLL